MKSNQDELPSLKKKTIKKIEKPLASYITLIREAIRKSENNELTLNGIYISLQKAYPCFRKSYEGWKNSVRHNLSLNACFIKVPKIKGKPGKGHFWKVDPDLDHLFNENFSRRRPRGLVKKISKKKVFNYETKEENKINSKLKLNTNTEMTFNNNVQSISNCSSIFNPILPNQTCSTTQSNLSQTLIQTSNSVNLTTNTYLQQYQMPTFQNSFGSNTCDNLNNQFSLNNGQLNENDSNQTNYIYNSNHKINNTIDNLNINYPENTSFDNRNTFSNKDQLYNMDKLNENHMNGLNEMSIEFNSNLYVKKNENQMDYVNCAYLQTYNYYSMNPNNMNLSKNVNNSSSQLNQQMQSNVYSLDKETFNSNALHSKSFNNLFNNSFNNHHNSTSCLIEQNSFEYNNNNFGSLSNSSNCSETSIEKCFPYYTENIPSKKCLPENQY